MVFIFLREKTSIFNSVILRQKQEISHTKAHYKKFFLGKIRSLANQQRTKFVQHQPTHIKSFLHSLKYFCLQETRVISKTQKAFLDICNINTSVRFFPNVTSRYNNCVFSQLSGRRNLQNDGLTTVRHVDVKTADCTLNSRGIDLTE